MNTLLVLLVISPTSTKSGWCFQTSVIFQFIYVIIFPIDELICFKMAIAQPTRHDARQFRYGLVGMNQCKLCFAVLGLLSGRFKLQDS
jgi:hypothetical protein